MQADALFQLDRVSLGTARLRNVTLTISRGITAVLGASGAGKTSLLNVLAGFEKPASGKLHGDTRVAWAPQGDGLWPGCTAREHLTECGASTANADTLLASFDLAHLANAKPPKLSRGEQSRLALARALAMSGWSRPEWDSRDGSRSGTAVPAVCTRGEGAAETDGDEGVAATGLTTDGDEGVAVTGRTTDGDGGVAATGRTLVLDEPLAHVDSARSGKFWSVIREHIRNTGASLVFATHAPEIALAEAEHAVCLRDGSVAFTGRVTDLYENPASAEIADFLGPANWLTPDDAQRWLGESWANARCVRPERVMITPAENSAAAVRGSRFFGSFAETELRAADGNTRTFIHRPAEALASGKRVRIGLSQANRP